MEINREVAEKVLATVDAGLCKGVGMPVPGAMCVEAAVCYAMGQPHGDEPVCVSSVLRAFKIALNDSAWSSNAVRAKGMRRLALIQLGTAGTLDEVTLVKQLAEMTIRIVVPIALRAAASMELSLKHKEALEAAAVSCENVAASYTARAAIYTARAASYAASEAASYAASYAASDAARAASDAASYAASSAARAASYAARAASDAASDEVLSKVAEAAVQILIGLGAAGTQWLGLTA